jgi:hypothetical protein
MRKLHNVVKADYSARMGSLCQTTFWRGATSAQVSGALYHRVAISNRRLTALQDGDVSFSWRDYRRASQSAIMTLETAEFIRRFLLHMLPRGFVKIRHFGFLANRGRANNIQLCRALLEVHALNGGMSLPVSKPSLANPSERQLRPVAAVPPSPLCKEDACGRSKCCCRARRFPLPVTGPGTDG